MTMIEVLNKYVNFLWERFMSDMDILSSPWMYIPFLIPFFFYMIFFVIKWYIILFPITFPISILKGWIPLRITNGKTKLNKRIYDKLNSTNEVLSSMHEDMVDSSMTDEDAEKLIEYWKKRYIIVKKTNV